MERSLSEMLEAARALDPDPVIARAWRRRAKHNARKALDDLVRVRLALNALEQQIEQEFAQSSKLLERRQ